MSSTRNLAAKDSYFELVRQFPLVTIKSGKHYDEAVAFLKKLAIRDEASLDDGEAAYLEALTLFVENYQHEHHAFDARNLKPLEALKFLMAETHMKPADLGRVIGSASLASQILRGHRELSKANTLAVASHFKVSPALFLQA